MADSEPPKSDVDSMFKKMGEKLGWFQHKDLDSAMKTLSEKKKHNKSRLKLKSKSGKENLPVPILDLQQSSGERKSKKTGKSSVTVFKDIPANSEPEHVEIPLRRTPGFTDIPHQNSSPQNSCEQNSPEDVFYTAPNTQNSDKNVKEASNQTNQKSSKVSTEPLNQKQLEPGSQAFREHSKEIKINQATQMRSQATSQPSSQASNDMSSQTSSQKLYNLSVIAAPGDKDMYSILEDVGIPLVESTRIYSRQSIDVFGLSINEETGENDSYENLKIKQKGKEEKRNSDLYTTAVESNESFYMVTDMATQTGKSLLQTQDKLSNSRNDSMSSEGSLYEVKDVSIQTSPTSPRNVIQSDEDLCHDFDKNMSISDNSQRIKTQTKNPKTDHSDKSTSSFIEESQLVLRLDTQDSNPAESSIESQAMPSKSEELSVKAESQQKINQAVKSKSKHKVTKNKINFSDSNSDDNFTPTKTSSVMKRRKHKLYTPSHESFLCPSLDETLSRSMVKSRLKMTPNEVDKSICQTYSDLLPPLPEKLPSQSGKQQGKISELETPAIKEKTVPKILMLDEDAPDGSHMVENSDTLFHEDENASIEMDAEFTTITIGKHSVCEDERSFESTPKALARDNPLPCEDANQESSSHPADQDLLACEDNSDDVLPISTTNNDCRSLTCVDINSVECGNSVDVDDGEPLIREEVSCKPVYDDKPLDCESDLFSDISISASPTRLSNTPDQSPLKSDVDLGNQGPENDVCISGQSKQIASPTSPKTGNSSPDILSPPSNSIETVNSERDTVPPGSETNHLLSKTKPIPNIQISDHSMDVRPKIKTSSSSNLKKGTKKMTKLKVIFSSSESEDNMLTPELTTSKFFTPNPPVKHGLSIPDNLGTRKVSDSGFFTPKAHSIPDNPGTRKVSDSKFFTPNPRVKHGLSIPDNPGTRKVSDSRFFTPKPTREEENHSQLNKGTGEIIESEFYTPKPPGKQSFSDSSSDSGEPSSIKYVTPKSSSAKKPSVSGKSKYFTPKSQVAPNFSDSDSDSPLQLNLERYRVTVQQPSPNWRSSRVISESSDDDDFDQFLESVKAPVKPVKDVHNRSMSDFIVDDDEVLSCSSNSESEEEEIFISIQSPKNRGCTIVSPASTRYSPSVVDVNKPLNQRMKTPTTTKRPFSTTSTELFKTPHRPKDVPTPKVRCQSEKVSVESNYSKYSFLKSLSTELDDTRRHPDAIKYIKQFKKNHEELTSRLFKLFNQTIFDNKLPEDMSITWNKRLLRTAGYCAYKRCHGKHVSRVELSTKVCDTPERVRDTLIHELCHAAVWMLNQRTDGHGPYWKYWARKSNLSHPELPIISRCHNYSITTKYTYTCTQCGYQVGRHSKSLDTTKKVCGHCHGRFELTTTPGSKEGTPRTPRTPNKFALFVKENYGSAKKTNIDLKHKDIMQLLSQQFAEKTKLNS